jgi:hypothetical protein
VAHRLKSVGGAANRNDAVRAAAGAARQNITYAVTTSGRQLVGHPMAIAVEKAARYILAPTFAGS